jgi:hypothetical protein
MHLGNPIGVLKKVCSLFKEEIKKPCDGFRPFIQAKLQRLQLRNPLD